MDRHKKDKILTIKLSRDGRNILLFSSVHFSRSVLSNSLRPHGLHQLLEFTQTHVHWIGDVIQPTHPLLFPPPPTFNLSQLQGMLNQFLSSGGQNIVVSALASVLPMNIQDWFPLGWTGWISLQSKGLSRVLSNTTVNSINSSAFSFLYNPTLTSIHDHWKNHSLG